MGLTNKKEDQLREQPIIQSKMFKSEDGTFFVHKTIITTIKPVSYVEKVISSFPEE